MKRFRFEQKKDGDSFVLRPGSRTPYKFVCCGVNAPCNLVHDLYGHIDDAGNIRVTVFRDNETTDALVADEALFDNDAVVDQDGHILFQVLGDVGSDAVTHHKMFLTDSATGTEKVPTMTRSRSRRFNDDDDFETVIGYDGKPARILKDGRSLHVSMEMRDSLRCNDDAARIAEAKRITEAVVATQLAMMKGDGSRDNPYVINTSANDTDWLHRPGYRLSDGDGDDDPLRRRRRKTVERDPMGREKATFEGDARAIAYNEMVRDAEEAWKKPAANFDATSSGYSAVPGENAVTRPLETIPPRGGIWPLSAGAGNPCQLDGEAGVLVREGDHLVCRVVTRVGPTRSGRSAGDSMSAEDAQPLRDAAYEQYVNEMRNAWRT